MGFFAAAIATIVSVVDPVGIAPIFLALTPQMGRKQQLSVIWKAVAIAAVILVIFAFGGQFMLRVLGITQPAFAIAGGVLLLLIAIDMLFARVSRTKDTPEEDAEALQSTDISVFPLAVPILAGPGAIATVILYMSQAGTDVGEIAAVLGAIAIALVASYLSMRISTLVMLVLRRTGVQVVSRVMGILLAALAVQFILNGVLNYYHHYLAH
jgi:multiple antibiotic resistance protein